MKPISVVRRAALALAMASGLASCADRITARDPAVATDVSPAVPTPPVVAWLAPLGTGTADPSTFDATAAPVVEVCTWVGGACVGSPLVRFSTTPGAGLLPLVANSTAGRYEADWSLTSTTLVTRKTYRIRVLQNGAELSAVSVDVVRGRWALARSDGTLAPLVAANTLPIRFGIARVTTVSATIGTGGGIVSLPDGPRIEVPPGAIQGGVTFTLSRTPPLGAAARIATGSPFVAARMESPTGPFRLDITVLTSTTFTPDGKWKLAMPLTPGLGTDQSSFFRGELDGHVLWKSAPVDPGTGLASSTFDLPQLTDLTTMHGYGSPVGITIAATALSLPDQPDDCAGYPALLREAAAAQARHYAVVFVHGWKADVESCSLPDQSFARALTNRELPGSYYFSNLLIYMLPKLANDASFYTYTYPTYRAFSDVGIDLKVRLKDRFGPGGPDANAAGIVFVGHSMGGLVARTAARLLVAEDPAWKDKIGGIITLGTPHTGSIAPTLELAGWALDRIPFIGPDLAGQLTPGAKSLVPPIGLPGSLDAYDVPIVAYGGNLSPGCSTTGVRPFCAFNANVTYGPPSLLMCQRGGPPHCESDGAVPIPSAVPSFIPHANRRLAGAWAVYNHSELKDGRTANDPIFLAIERDIRLLAVGTAPTSPSNLVAVTGGSSVVNISWTDNSADEDGFTVEIAPASSGPFTIYSVTAADATTMQVRVNPSSTTYVRVAATRLGQISAYSNTAAMKSLSVFPWNATAGATSLNNKIYAFSPKGYYWAAQASASYDPTVDQWILGPTFGGFGEFGNASAPVAIGNRIFIVGGHHGYSSYLNNGLLIYDTSNDTWSVGAAHPQPTHGGVAGAISNLLYVFTSVTGLDNATGGAVDVHAFNVYDPVRDVWSALPLPPQRYRQRTGGAIGNRFYLIGGADVDGQAVSTVDIFDPATNTWTTGRPMPRARHLASSATSANRLYVVGGYRSGASYCGHTGEVDVYDAATNSWTSMAPLILGRSLSAVAIVRNQLFVAGGAVGCDGLSSSLTTDVEVIDLLPVASSQLKARPASNSNPPPLGKTLIKR